MLLVAKLKGKALIWLQANAMRISEPTDRLCYQLILEFSTMMSNGVQDKGSILTSRRKIMLSNDADVKSFIWHLFS